MSCKHLPRHGKSIYHLLLLFVLISSGAAGQTTTYTFDYTTFVQGTSNCKNVFANALPVGTTQGNLTAAHQTVYGAPNLNPYGSGAVPTNGIQLDAYFWYNTGTTTGTEYYIHFPFKQGFSYTVSVTAGSFLNGTISGVPTMTLRYAAQSDDPNKSSTCSDNQAVTFDPAFETNHYQTGVGQAFNDFNNILHFTPTSSDGYLYVASTLPIAGNGADANGGIYIRKIVITETTNFTMSPTSVSATCGSSTTQTFTVSNVNNVQGVSSYQWNLGSDKNGWLYNGSAAPQTITTSTNSLTLASSSCAGSLQNVAVTVNVNNAPFITLQSTASFSVLTPSLNVTPVICSGATPTYSINNLFCNATVTWQATPAGLVTIASPNAVQTVITQGSSQSGNVTLTATITGGCTGSKVLTTTIGVGTPQLGSYYPKQSPRQTGMPIQYVNYNSATKYLLYTHPLSSSAETWNASTDDPNFTWGYDPGGGFVWFYYSGSGYTTTFYGSETNPCGSSYGYIYCKSVASGGAGGGTPLSFTPGMRTGSQGQGLNNPDKANSGKITIYPNPAYDLLNVSAVAGPVKAVKVFDMAGKGLPLTRKPGDGGNFAIDISPLTAGVYVVRILIGSEWYTEKFIKQ